MFGSFERDPSMDRQGKRGKSLQEDERVEEICKMARFQLAAEHCMAFFWMGCTLCILLSRPQVGSVNTLPFVGTYKARLPATVVG